jgi:rhodanese-related sulfurtransferase
LIPFNKIDGYRNQLPEDKDSRIVVYCMMGPMGSMAAKKLAGMGYTRVFNLQGGMMAWEKIGKSLLIRTQ